MNCPVYDKDFLNKKIQNKKKAQAKNKQTNNR